MPKVIENLQERILACARVLLLEQGIDGLNIRAVASACGVAVGTVYNYYGSKDQLIASIMLQNWLQSMREAAGEVNTAATARRRGCAPSAGALTALPGDIACCGCTVCRRAIAAITTNSLSS